MIGLDTNILLRAITGDDRIRTPLALRRLSELTPDNQGVVNSVVLAELAWTLRRGYGHTRSEIAGLVNRMMQSSCYFFPDRDAVNAALTRCAEEKLNFADALIAELNRKAGCESTLTFDEGAAVSKAFSLVAE